MGWNRGRVGNGEKMEDIGDRIEGRRPGRSRKGIKIGKEKATI